MSVSADDHVAEVVLVAARLEELAQEGHLQLASLSLLTTALSKHAVVSAASFYERRVLELLLALFTDAPIAIREFVQRKALDRQFMNLFDFKSTNANTLFKLFGQDASVELKKSVEQDPELPGAIRAFLQICGERNRLVHNDFSSLETDLSVGDVISLMTAADRFLGWLEDDLPGFIAGPR